MKNLIFLAIVCSSCIFSGCFGYKAMLGTSYSYDYALLKNDSLTNKTDTLKSMVYSDNKISVSFNVSSKSVNFDLTNKTDSPMKLIWDEASIVLHGQANKVMHNGVKFIDRNSSQPASIIPPKASISDVIIPADNVYYREGYYSKYASMPGGWEKRDIFLMYDANKPETQQIILSMKGQKFSVFMPIQHNGSTLNYNFNFIIKDVQPVVSTRQN